MTIIQIYGINDIYLKYITISDGSCFSSFYEEYYLDI